MIGINRFKIILALLFFNHSILISQNSFDFNGYLLNLNLIQINRYNKHNNFQNIDRLRLRPEINLNDFMNFTLEHETFMHFKNGSEFFPEKYKSITGQLINLHFTLLNNRIWQIIHFIDRMYLRINLDKINFTLGRQRIAWGTGRIWNPTDLFNPISPTNFAKIEKDGVDAALIKYNIASLTDITLVVNPTKTETNYAFRFRTNFSEFDVSLMSGKFSNDFKLGADFAGNLLNAGIRGEMITSLKNIKYILGIDYQFSPKLYSLIEYHFNGEGKSRKETYDFINLLNSNSIYMAKNYLVVQLSYIVHPLSTITVLVNKNLNDCSIFYSLNLSYSILDNFNVNWITNVFTGSRYTEYWYYPSNLIIRSEYYF